MVLNSKYTKTFGIHNDVIGLAYFIAVLLTPVVVLATLIYGSDETFALGITTLTLLIGTFVAIHVGTFLATVMTIRLLYVQFFIIKKMCFWCLISSFCVLGMTAMLMPSLVTDISNFLSASAG